MKNFFSVIFFLFISFISLAQVINAGVSGNSTKQLLNRIEKDVISLQPDLTIVMVGTNDLLNSKKMITLDQYEKNLSLIVSKLKKEGSEVLLMSSPPVDSTYLFMRHNKNLYKQTPHKLMESASKIVEKVALENEALFLNVFRKFEVLELPKHNEDLFFRNPKNSGSKDGVHPTTLGYHFIAANTFQFLKDNKLLEKKTKIICFGDSITIGAGSKGKGTITGENYPSFLSIMIIDYLNNQHSK